MKNSRLLGAICACLTLVSTNVIAADKFWICGNGSWDDGSCWSPSGQPISGENVFLTQSDSINRTITYTNPLYPSAQVGSITIDSTGTGSVSLEFSQGTFDFNSWGSPRLQIGYQGTGTVNQTGGAITDSNWNTWVHLGDQYNPASQGTYNLTNGTFEAFILSVVNQSVFNQSGGTVTTEMFGQGGTYNMSGGQLTLTDIASVSGVFNQTGGDVYRYSYLGYISGSYNLSAGTFSGYAPDISGTFNHSGGIRTSSYNDLNIGTGIYNLSGGSVSDINQIIGAGGSGTFNQTGGTNTVSDTITLALDPGSSGTYNLDGGTLTVGTIVRGAGTSVFNFNSGTFNLTNSDLTIGNGGLFGDTLQLNSTQVANVTLDTVINSDGLLVVDNGALTSTNYTNSGEILLNSPVARLKGGNLDNSGLVRGDGRVETTLTNLAAGEVRAQAGDRLLFTAAGNTNAGDINLLGGTAEFTQDLTNTSSGVIAGRGTLITTGGLTNQGNIGLSSGTTDIFGEVNNATGGAIIVSGNSTATFYDDLVHNGSEIRVSGGSNAVFFGAVSGSGSYTGTGSLFFEGDLNPGNSPGLVNIEGDMSLGLSSRTIMEIAGLNQGTEYDAFDIGGDLWLGGELEVSLYDFGSGLFAPQLGDSFDLFMADTITGDFDLLTLAALSGGLDWQVNVLADAIGFTDVVRLSIVTSAVPIPPSVWLFASGLLGMIGVARRRQSH